MLNLEKIENRIREYQVELAVLRTSHEHMVAAQQKATETFNEKVNANQIRFQQLSGAIAELEDLKKEFLSTNGEGQTKRHPRLDKSRIDIPK